MQKKLVLGVIFISILILSISFASAFSLLDIGKWFKSLFSGPQLSPEDERSTSYSCDSDSEFNIYNRESVAVAVSSCNETEFAASNGSSGCFFYSDILYDVCIDENTLAEMICESEEFSKREITCDYGCVDGACKQSSLCDDSASRVCAPGDIIECGDPNTGSPGTQSCNGDCSGFDDCVVSGCASDSDCDDWDSCTIDSCSSGTCSNEFNPTCDPCYDITCNECESCVDGNCEYIGCDPCDGVTSCNNDDGCCPEGCDNMNDNDCIGTEICDNGEDDDGDNDIDCMDSDCAGEEALLSPSTDLQLSPSQSCTVYLTCVPKRDLFDTTTGDVETYLCSEYPESFSNSLPSGCELLKSYDASCSFFGGSFKTYGCSGGVKSVWKYNPVPNSVLASTLVYSYSRDCASGNECKSGVLDGKGTARVGCVKTSLRKFIDIVKTPLTTYSGRNELEIDNIGGQVHMARFEDFDKNTGKARLDIYSDPTTIYLEVGQEENADLNGDGVIDLTVSLDSISIDESGGVEGMFTFSILRDGACASDSDCGENEEIRYCAENYVCTNVVEHYCENAGMSDAYCSERYPESGCEPSSCDYGCESGACKDYILCDDEMNRACSSGDIIECSDPNTGASGTQSCNGDCSGFDDCVVNVDPSCYSDSDCQAEQSWYCDGDYVCVDTPMEMCNNPGQMDAYCSNFYTETTCDWTPCTWGCSDGGCNDYVLCDDSAIRACAPDETITCWDNEWNEGISTCNSDCSGFGDCVVNVAPQCYENSDCGEYMEMPPTCDGNGYICQGAVLPICNNPGRADAECSQITFGGCAETACEFGCESGQCINWEPECSSDSDCPSIECFAEPCPVNVCEEERCVAKILDSCIDTDNSPVDYEGYGELFVNGESTPRFVDNCDGNVLNEGACENGIMSSSNHECVGGTCSQGMCIPITPECSSDSDCGEDSEELECVGNYIFTTSIKNYCVEGKCEKAFSPGTAELPCKDGCVDGGCILKNNTEPCISMLSCATAPSTCPENGVQIQTCTDITCGTDSVTKQISCDPGVCSGCLSGEQCIPYGFKLALPGYADSVLGYCDIDGVIKMQMMPGDSCQNDFECKSSVCTSGKCMDLEATIREVGVLKEMVVKLFCRISSMFDKIDYDQCVLENSFPSG